MKLLRMLSKGGRRGVIATVATVLLAATGIFAVVVALVEQHHAPQPAASAAGSIGGLPASSAEPGGAGAQVVGLVLRASSPVAVDIPAIGVHSRLLHLGETAQGTLQVPQPGPDYNEAAWYQGSPTPGSLGPAILLGHVDSVADGASVFFELGALRPRDKVLVTRSDGSIATFSVDGVRRYAKDRFPTALVYGNTDHAALRLLTCGGPFDNATGHYRDNIVVFASLIGATPVTRHARTT